MVQLNELLGYVARERDDEPPLYARACDECGFLEISEDPLLVVAHIECPSCSVRGRGHA